MKAGNGLVVSTGVQSKKCLKTAKSMRSPTQALEDIRRRKAGEATEREKAKGVIVVQRPTTCLARCRIRVGIIMANFWMEVAMMVVTIMYAGLVLFDLLAPDDLADDAEGTILALDIAFLSILGVELCLKLFAYGREYCRDGWNLFDGLVVVFSIVLGLMAEALQSIVLLRVLKARAVLRVFRLVVVFRRAKQTAFVVKRIKKRVAKVAAIKTPLEEAVDILQRLRHEMLSSRQRKDLLYVEELLSAGSLFRPTHLPDLVGTDGKVDTEMELWLRGQLDDRPKSGLRGTSPDSSPGSVGIDDTGGAIRRLSGTMASQCGLKTRRSDVDLEEEMAARIASTGRRVSVMSFRDGFSPKSVGSSTYRQALDDTMLHQPSSIGDDSGSGSGSGSAMSSRRDSKSSVGGPSAVTTSSKKPPRRSQVAPSDGGSGGDGGGGGGGGSGSGSGGGAIGDGGIASNMRGVPNLGILPTQHGKLETVMGQLNVWEFDVFEADRLTNKHALYAVSVALAEALDVLRPTKVDQVLFQHLLLRLEAGYDRHNTYHNAIHAADVTQSLAFFLAKPFLLPHLTSVEKLGALLAAIVHDLGHPGVNNAFLVATGDDIALTYNDQSVLENMHVAKFYQIMKAEGLDITKTMIKKDRAAMRNVIIDMVLGTDMTKHFEEVARFSNKVSSLTKPAEEGSNVSSPRTLGNHIQDSVDSLLYLRLALHTADVSNPAKPQRLALEWTNRVVEEFYAQGDKESEAGLPISSFMDRTKPNLPKLQLGFINFIVQPLFEQWALVIDSVDKSCLPYLHANKSYWTAKSEGKVATSAVAPAVEPVSTTTETEELVDAGDSSDSADN